MEIGRRLVSFRPPPIRCLSHDEIAQRTRLPTGSRMAAMVHPRLV